MGRKWDSKSEKWCFQMYGFTIHHQQLIEEKILKWHNEKKLEYAIMSKEIREVKPNTDPNHVLVGYIHFICNIRYNYLKFVLHAFDFEIARCNDFHYHKRGCRKRENNFLLLEVGEIEPSDFIKHMIPRTPSMHLILNSIRMLHNRQPKKVLNHLRKLEKEDPETPTWCPPKLL